MEKDKLLKIYTRPYLIYEDKDFLVLVYPQKEVRVPIQYKSQVEEELNSAELVIEKQ